MELQFNQNSFKSQAKKLHAAMKARGVECKLADALEALAVSYGYANLATLYGAFKAEDARYVDDAPMWKQPNNLFILTWTWTDENEELAVYPPNTSLDAVTSSHWKIAAALRDQIKVIPEGVVFSQETTVLETFSEVPAIDKYGIPPLVEEYRVNEWVFDTLGFRVPRDGVTVGLYDRNDDGSNSDFVLVWLTDADAALVRSWFAQDSY